MEEAVTTTPKPKTLQINLIQEKALDKKGKDQKDPQGKQMYKRDDFIGLINLLNKYDTRLHHGQMQNTKTYLRLKDHVIKNWTDDNQKLELSLDEASFLKTYLSEVTDKEAKDVPLAEFEIRTMVGVLEQLE